jgi:hypothetical protein
MPHRDFDGLAVPKMHLNSKPDVRAYRVYSTHDEFVVVDADAAHEAIEKSGIEHPLRIINVSQALGLVLDDDMLESSDEDALLPVSEEGDIQPQNFTAHAKPEVAVPAVEAAPELTPAPITDTITDQDASEPTEN